MVQEEVTVQGGWGRRPLGLFVGAPGEADPALRRVPRRPKAGEFPLRESKPFRGAKGDFTRTPAHVTRDTRSLNHAIYCASRGKALLDKILLNTRNWDLPAARHVLFCGVSTRTVEKFWRLLEVLAAKHFRIESLPLDEAQ